jgi:hypothetical protein
MAFQSVWYYTDLPEDIVDIIERDVSAKRMDSYYALGWWIPVALYSTCKP